MLKKMFQDHPDHLQDKVYSEIIEVPHEEYYGQGYQDIFTRKPSITNAKKILGWTPRTDLETSLKITLDAFVEEARLYNNQIEGHEIY
jgi:nucleoside-diphosphate-sugar epimerase